MNEHTRKNSLRLQGYDYSRPGAYFITLCTKNGEMMFGEVVYAPCAKMKLTAYGTVVQTVLEQVNEHYANLRLEAYIIMPNHIHMLIQIIDRGNYAETEITSNPCKALTATVVRTLKTLTTKAIGFSLWQRSYYDNIVRNAHEYEIIKNYIENNPSTWAKDKFYCTPINPHLV